MPERFNWIGCEAEQQHNRGVNRCCEGERAEEAPEPLHRRQRATPECDIARSSRSLRGASAPRPPHIEPEEKYFDDGSERHPETQEECRPHIGSNKSDENACNNGP